MKYIVTILSTALFCFGLFFWVYRNDVQYSFDETNKSNIQIHKTKDSLFLEIQKIPTYQNFSETNTEINNKKNRGGEITQKIETKPKQEIKNK